MNSQDHETKYYSLTEKRTRLAKDIASTKRLTVNKFTKAVNYYIVPTEQWYQMTIFTNNNTQRRKLQSLKKFDAQENFPIPVVQIANYLFASATTPKMKAKTPNNATARGICTVLVNTMSAINFWPALKDFVSAIHTNSRSTTTTKT